MCPIGEFAIGTRFAFGEKPDLEFTKIGEEDGEFPGTLVAYKDGDVWVKGKLAHSTVAKAIWYPVVSDEGEDIGDGATVD